MKFVPTAIPDVVRVEPQVHEDKRGSFFESWNAVAFECAGIDARFVQCNQSRSARGVLRGLHYQDPDAQGKLIRVTAGAVWDVAVDLRRGSATFGRFVAVDLAEDDPAALWIPPGFAHGFYARADRCDVLYFCTAPYRRSAEHTLRWDDPELAIPWPLDGPPIVSERDAAGTPWSRAHAYGD